MGDAFQLWSFAVQFDGTYLMFRGGSRTAATSKVELFVIIVNGWKPLTIITKSSTLDVAGVLDPPLMLLDTLGTCRLRTVAALSQANEK